MVDQRIKQLRELMEANEVDAYIVPTEDFHNSEYVGEYFKTREYISGFTGSAGTVLVTKDKAFLWTDGRYFLQAAKQLAGSEVILQKMGEPGVPTLANYLRGYLAEGGTIGFDGRCISINSGDAYIDIIDELDGSIAYQDDLIGEIWTDRPSLSKAKAFFLEEKYSGESQVSKLARLREAMKEQGADVHILNTLDDICWLFNIRGGDVESSPLVLSYAVITLDEVHLFVDQSKFDDQILDELAKVEAELHDYNDIYEFVTSLESETGVLIDAEKINFTIYQNLPEDCNFIFKINPTTVFKAAKNEVELANTRIAQTYDGVAWVKFMKWLKENVGNTEITEIQASDKLESFRKEWDSYIEPSFSPISGYGPNGAIVHYKAEAETQAKLEAKGLYLSDTGSHYYEGTTDITRTVALGELTDEMKTHYTIVLKSHIALARAVFLKGTVGSSIDILARKPFWDNGLDFKHGTGHGVGYLMNVHEGPARIHYSPNKNPDLNYPLILGLIITDEPGIYIEGSHGIRTENELVVREHMKTEHGEFYKFEVCTYVPIDMEPIKVELLDDGELAFLNEYHKTVYDRLSPYMQGEDLEALKAYTKELTR
ncbi:MAG: aminopeptidase P family protein [Bacillota bacterium]|nr:aminopeptidase P family protein [Bacillota bacterium]